MYIGIDIGTSAVKVVCSDTTRIVATAAVELETSSPQPGWSEQPPDIWWRATCDALHTLGTSVRLSDVKAIGLSGQMHGAVLLDANKTPIRPAILWNDSRSVAECDQLRQAVPQIGTTSGVLPLPGFTAPKIMWLKRYEPENYARISHILLPKDYVALKLHGHLATDISDAAGTMWLDQSTRDWNSDVAAASDTSPDWLPPLHHGHDVVAAVSASAASETGLKTGTPVVAGGGDAATGAVSLGATEPGRGFISLGTSGQLFVADDTYKPNPEKYVHAFAHTLPDRWYQMAAMLNGARPIAWIAEQLGVTAGEVITLAQTANTERVPIFLPYLTGERSPHGDPHIRACFFGLEDATTRAEICRAVVESVAFCFADAAESFGETIQNLPALSAIGGGSRSDLLLGLIASVIDKPIERSAGSDTGPAFGAVRLAACGDTALSISDLSVQTTSTATFEPSPYDALSERLERFRTFYQTVRVIA